MNNNSIFKSQPNFRDLGGVHTKSGQKVKENSIFRSSFLGKMDENELFILKDLNVGEILDLRTSQEIDLIGKGDYPESINYQNIPLNAGNITKSLIPIFTKGEFHLLDSNILEQIYFDLITKFTTELASIYREILNANNGIIYHCSHGKDRTGIISALLLDFFEVDRKHIYSDYLMSNEFLKKSNDYQLQMIKDNFSKQFNREVSEEEFAPVKSLFYVHEGILKNIFEYIDKTHGSVRNYFQSELGLNEEEIELLKSKYLE
ncbi:tyrosine-protein phosphatase [Bizionia arctica]|uniref:Protein-tyrosine-phosphatase n=1 Tax=Bizionia arctica TaxID=1495645 RepID=A0A917LTV3_9FLAO|nr:tyrosine-protein phosphatase [Bizionia arctica]GGG56631.1 protein-tyrosine-phosphatase [Bizionia arctica]